jgi:HlyD family secretion protein
MSTVRRIVGWIVILALIGGGAWGYYRWRNSAAAMQVKTVKATRMTIAGKVTATGTLSARITVQVGSQVSGRIAELLVDYNSPVKKGQLLAKIDDRVLKAEVIKARASVAQAGATYNKSKATAALSKKAFERLKGLHDQGIAAQADVDTAESTLVSAEADISVAEAQIATAQAALNEAEINLDFATISAPIDGVVLTRSVDVGQTVAASLSAPTLFTIAQDLRVLQLDTSVTEGDVSKLTAGMTATFTVDAFPGRTFTGKVREVRNAATIVQNVVTYDAVIDVVNDSLELRPSMTATVTFVYQERKDVLALPNAALRFKPSPDLLATLTPPSASASAGRAERAKAPKNPNQKMIWKYDDNKPSRVFVEVGMTDGTNTEIVSGLDENTPIISDILVGAAAKASSGSNPFSVGGAGTSRRN